MGRVRIGKTVHPLVSGEPMRKILIAATAVMLAAGASLFGASAAEKLKIGFIYLGPIGDLGWTYQHELARQAVVKEFGDKIETTYLENVPEGPDAERAIEQLVRAGNKLIFTTSFGYMDPTLKVAKKYPNVHFEHATGYKRDKNMATYSARWYQGRYIQGQIAARMSKAGVLGYIGSFPIPEVVSGINATMLGAQTVNPNIKVKIIWVNTWFDPGKEADAAKALLDQGADVIMQHTDSPAAMQAANERGKFALGQGSGMQGRRSPRRRPGARHELLCQGHRRQGAGEVAVSSSSLLRDLRDEGHMAHCVPSPLVGRVREGGEPRERCQWYPPLSNSPPQGGREPSVLVAATFAP